MPGTEGDASGARGRATDANKAVVRRLIEDVINGGRLEVADEIFAPPLSAAAPAWIAPFRQSFPDVHMAVVALVAEGDEVAARFSCSATHLGAWQGHQPTGRRFENVDEVFFFRLSEGRITEAWGLEDTGTRLRQLGLA